VRTGPYTAVRRVRLSGDDYQVFALRHSSTTEKSPAGETQSGRWCASKDVTDRMTQPKLAERKIGQVNDSCQEKKGPSRTPGLSEF
jgi:hypothetical protein